MPSKKAVTKKKRSSPKRTSSASPGKLTYKEKKELPDSEFAIPADRKYPIENEAHARNALARVSRFGNSEEQQQVCKAVEKRYPEIHSKFCTLHG